MRFASEVRKPTLDLILILAHLEIAHTIHVEKDPANRLERFTSAHAERQER